jgi:outer membrane lipoprotein-sorting protein
MSKPNLPLIVLLLLGISAQASADLTLDEVMSRHLSARGSAEKLNAMKSIRQTGRLDMGGGQVATLVIEQKRPSLLRMELFRPGSPTLVRAYDGKNGWVLMPTTDQAKPTPADPATLQELVEESEFGGPLLGWKDRGHNLELLGREKIDGKDCYKLELTRKESGDKRTFYLDAETFLEVRITGDQQAGSFLQTLSDNKPVDGLTFPFTSAVEITAPNGQTQKFVYKVEKIEINPDLPDERFKMSMK